MVRRKEGAAMKITPEFPLQIFYDGSCSVCAREVERYGRMDRHGRLVLIDISSPGFDPDPFRISLEQFMYQLHAVDGKSTVFRGVDAFWAIWQAFPSSTLLGLCGTLITLPLINPLARLCYRAFASIHAYLPKKRSNCLTDTCRIGRK
jgi:predicted DCC family thiol-disulfide oxidoreductase YuxK